MRNRRNSSYILIVLIAALVFTVSIAAEENLTEVQMEVDEANAEIDVLIAEAQAEAGEEDADLDAIIKTLITKTNEVASRTIEKAAELGYTVECQYKTVLIDDQEVEIDPLYVVAD